MIYDGAILPFLPAAFRVSRARAGWELRGYYRLRRQVFCTEQKIFPSDDRDAIDAVADPLIALTCVAGDPDSVVGAVRIHQVAPGHWWGSRLAVQSDFRRIGSIGGHLVRLAVCTAHARGCTRFEAHVQASNVGFFERLGWHAEQELLLHGLPHWLMRADLSRYPPHGQEALGFVRPYRAAA